jgi:hypothetical protein
MRQGGLLGFSGSVGLLAMLLTAGCVVAPPAGVPAAPAVRLLPADARALRYGASAPAAFDNPELREKVRGLFGSDWAPAVEGGGRLQHGAAAYFPSSSALRMLRIEGQDYIAITGCVPRACATHRGLVLVRADGEELWARLDEGGFARYYGYGPAVTAARVSPSFIDGAWRAVEQVERA